MGIVHTHRGRLAPALILAVLMALAVIVTLGLAASPASAQSTFTTCAGCHSVGERHPRTRRVTPRRTCRTVSHCRSGAAGVRPAGCATAATT